MLQNLLISGSGKIDFLISDSLKRQMQNSPLFPTKILRYSFHHLNYLSTNTQEP